MYVWVFFSGVLTGIRYFLLDSDVVIDPMTIAVPEIAISVPSGDGDTYALYRGLAVSHEVLFSLTLVGHVALDDAAEALAVTKESWINEIGSLRST